MKKLIVFMVIIIGLYYIGNSGEPTTTPTIKKTKKIGCHFSDSKLRLRVKLDAPSYFNYPSSFDDLWASWSPPVHKGEGIYVQYFQAEAKNAFGHAINHQCTAIVEFDKKKCTYTLLNLIATPN